MIFKELKLDRSNFSVTLTISQYLDLSYVDPRLTFDQRCAHCPKFFGANIMIALITNLKDLYDLTST